MPFSAKTLLFDIDIYFKTGKVKGVTFSYYYLSSEVSEVWLGFPSLNKACTQFGLTYLFPAKLT